MRKLASAVLAVCVALCMLPAMAAMGDVQTVKFGQFTFYLPAYEGVLVSGPNIDGDYAWGSLMKGDKYVSVQIERKGPVTEDELSWLVGEQGFVACVPADGKPVITYDDAVVCCKVSTNIGEGSVRDASGEWVAMPLYAHVMEMRCYVGEWYVNLSVTMEVTHVAGGPGEQLVSGFMEQLVALLRRMYPADMTPDPSVYEVPADASQGSTTRQFVVITAASGMIRSEASLSGGLIKTAQKGETYALIRQSGDWYVIHVDGRTGYLHKGVAEIQ